jgi:hypothetical protein
MRETSTTPGDLISGCYNYYYYKYMAGSLEQLFAIEILFQFWL